MQRHEDTNQEGVNNFHLCLTLAETFLCSSRLQHSPRAAVETRTVLHNPFLSQLQSSEVRCFCAWSGECFVTLQEWSRPCGRLLYCLIWNRARMRSSSHPCWEISFGQELFACGSKSRGKIRSDSTMQHQARQNWNSWYSMSTYLRSVPQTLRSPSVPVVYR